MSDSLSRGRTSSAEGRGEERCNVTAPVIGVLALQGDVREHVAALAAAGADARPVRRPAELDAVDGLVIPGRRVHHHQQTRRHLRDARADRQADRRRHAGLRLLRRDDHAGDRGAGRSTRPAGLRRHRHDRPAQRVRPAGRLVRGAGGRSPGCRGSRSTRCSSARRGSSGSVPASRCIGTVTDGPAADRIVAVRQGNLVATSFHPELTGDLRVHAYFVDLVRAAS